MPEPSEIDERGAADGRPAGSAAAAAPAARPGASRRTPASLTRFTFFRRTLLLNFYPVLTVAAGNGILLGVPQAREALGAFRNFAETAESLWANASYWIFIAALAYWSLTAWYCARLLLAKRFAVDNVGQCAHHGFAAATNTWLPRALGLLSCVPITIWFALPGAPPGAWLAPALYTGAFLLLAVLRRKLVNRWLGRQAVAPQAWARSRRTPRVSIVAVLLMFAVSGLVLAAVWFGQEAASRALGAPALLLFAFGSWTVFGSIVLVYLPKSAGWPSLALLPLFAACWPRSRTRTISWPATTARRWRCGARRWPRISAPGRRRAAPMAMSRSTWWRPPAAPRGQPSGPAPCCSNSNARRAARAGASPRISMR
jgi:hypothetical protein